MRTSLKSLIVLNFFIYGPILKIIFVECTSIYVILAVVSSQVLPMYYLSIVANGVFLRPQILWIVMD